ncbi:hypothetical protein G3570_01510 [Balneolaceae bacterium YR4-1]|uniref:ADP,ATP carrier protein n=1 Tax=Halalkalibaculum roseum TaxID=2709311 RepID=A0A6M1SWB0_9BACT|nr:Npt1/Npt2 family nucleotide transporter [Halalkalibaculum roseum]NGP75294.1 hypothetical protein [Halalkalibaculum roseum]
MPYIKEALKALLKRVFGIRDGEYRTAILMQFNIFLLIATLLIVKPTVNALFLARFGAERLPEAFILVAVTALLISTVYARLIGKTRLNYIIERTLLISFATLVLFLILLRLNILEGWVLYLFYIWVAIFAVLSSSQFWILANLVYNVREAKRLFGFIGAGAIAGGIFGGYLTNLLAPVIGSENLIFISATFLLLCIPITRLIWKENISSLTVFRRRRRLREYGEHPLKTILSSRHLSYLAAIIGVSVIVAKLVDFQFSDIAHRAITDADELAAFFGFWFSTINLLSLAVQLFLTSRLVGTLGVGTSLLFLPFGIFLGAVTLFLFPELWAAIVIKTADGSLKQSINKSATELLGLPIDMEIKSKTKTFIDVVVDSTATGIAGFILIFIVISLDLSTRFVSAAIILLIGIWIYLIYKVRREYLRSFKFRMEEASDGDRLSPEQVSIDSIVQGIEKVLVDGSEQQILYLLKQVREFSNDQLFDHISELLGHPSSTVRAEAIRTLYHFRNRDLVERIKPFINDPAYEVKKASFEYLFEHAYEDASDLLSIYLDHSDQEIADAALESLAVETRDNETLKIKYDLKKRIRDLMDAVEGLSDTRAHKTRKLRLLDILGNANIPEYYPYIRSSFSEDDPEVVGRAVESAGNSFNHDFLSSLIGFLASDTLRPKARSALVKYGAPVIDPLVEAVVQRTYSMEALRSVPSVIEHFDTQKAVAALFNLLDEDDYLLQMKAVKSLNNLKSSHPELRFNKKEVARRILEEGKVYLSTLSAMHTQIILAYKRQKRGSEEENTQLTEARRNLIELLEKRLDNDLERIFGLLGLKYPPDDIGNALEGIRSNKPEQRINAIEFLDNLLEPDLKRVLIPIVETTILDAISEETLDSLNLEILSEKECFELLLGGNDQRIKLAVLQLIALLGDEKYMPVVKPYTESDNPTIQSGAKEALVKLSQI